MDSSITRAVFDELASDGGRIEAGRNRSEVERIQTHISWVLLTSDRVYKFRKAVSLGFLDFSSRQARFQDCIAEIELNRRLSPDVYLGLAALVQDETGARILPAVALEDADPGLEQCVVMRRLRTRSDALSMLEEGELFPAHIDQAAQLVADFHLRYGLGIPSPFSTEEWLARIREPIEANVTVLETRSASLTTRNKIRNVAEAANSFLRDRADRFERRRIDGRAVDGHGDLHLQHLWYESDELPPFIIDCLEFNAALRRIDAASDVSFLAMDLRYRGHDILGERFLANYAAVTDDFDLYRVVDFYAAYRACVRAKVAAIAAGERELDATQRDAAMLSVERHMDLADQLLGKRGSGEIFVTCGMVGSGKSTVAATIADRISGVLIRSDRVRKMPDAFTAETDRYSDTNRERVYEAMLSRAQSVVRSGRNVILDATFSRPSWRSLVLDWAKREGIEAQLLWVEANEDTTLARLRSRARVAADPSEAGPEQFEGSRAEFIPPGEWPAHSVTKVDTTLPDWQDGLRLNRKIEISQTH